MTVKLIENSFKRRDRLVIMAEIMDICKNGSSKTHIMFKANLSFTQLNLYLDSLFQLGLLEKFACGDRCVYRSTDKGREFMKMQQEIFNLLNESDQIRGLEFSIQLNPSMNRVPETKRRGLVFSLSSKRLS